MRHTKSFIENTAKDYDMSVDEVRYVTKNASDEEFYPLLEEFIKDRANIDRGNR